MEAISSAIANLTTVVGDCISFITGNPILVILLVSGTVVPAGFKMFRMAKRSSR